MKKLILALTAIIMVGCDYQNPDGSYNTSNNLYLETIVIDSCEYVKGYCMLAHKGNCRFCQQRMRDMIEETRR